jgi:hypothetical protein
MTTLQVPESVELAAALQLVADHLGPDFASRYVRGLAGAAAPNNGRGAAAELPWDVRTRVATAARQVAAERPEHAALLEDFANGIAQSLAMHRANGGRY